MTDLDLLLLGAVVSFVAAAGAYVAIRDQFGYRDGLSVEPQLVTPQPVSRMVRATDRDRRPALNG